jgi:zinc protease
VKVVVEHDPPALLARVQVIVRSGSLADPEDRPGLAHFTARAMLRGTRRHGYAALADAIERMGASLGAHVEPTRTVFGGVVLARHLDGFLDLLREVLTEPAFPPAELDTLRSIIAGELQSNLQDVRTLAALAARQRAWAGTAAARPAAGRVAALGNLTPEDAAAFHRARYVRENLVVGVASPLDPARAEERLRACLEGLGSGPADARAAPHPRLRGRQAILVPRPGLSTTPLYVAVPGVGDGDPDLPALEVGNFVFGADFTSRLSQVLRGENGWTYGAYSDYWQLLPPQSSPALFSLYTYPSAEHAALAIPRALAMLEEYGARGVTAEEFAAARSALTNRYAFEVDTAEKRLAHRLRERLGGRPFDSVDAYRARLGALTPDALNRTVAERTPVQDALIVAVGDPEALEPVLRALPGVENLARMDVEP